ncbi:MAG: ATP-grasp domain-containing protein [Clostridia bacterium]|nr:ATP-grasp domain-containing protein [Clostridia bacterium]
MKKIVIIGANSFQNKLILKAKQLGFQTHVFAWKCGDVGEKTADFFYPVSITDKEEILAICKKIKPDAITSVASDLAMITVSYVASNLGLTCNDFDCVNVTTNKYAMRKKLKSGGLFTPKFLKVSQDNCKDMLSQIKNTFFQNENCSVIIKPTDRSGSRGITKVDKFEDVPDALQRSFENSFEKSAIIEEFINGDEYSCECISFDGKHKFLTVTKKLTTGAPHFIETGHIQPADLSQDQISLVKDAIFKALSALDIKYGASHSEFRIDNGQIKIIEIGARMGGDCIGSDLVFLSTGFDFLKMVIDVSCGKEPDMTIYPHKNKAQIHFIFNNDDLEKLNLLKTQYPDSIYFISDIEKIGSRNVVDSSTRFGYYILTD